MDEERDFEKEATSQGWNRDGALDAEAFVRKGEEILPIVNAKNRKLSEQVEALSSKVSNLEGTSNQFREFAAKAVEKAELERNLAISQLETARGKAVEENNGAEFNRTDAEINRLLIVFVMTHQ